MSTCTQTMEMDIRIRDCVILRKYFDTNQKLINMKWLLNCEREVWGAGDWHVLCRVGCWIRLTMTGCNDKMNFQCLQTQCTEMLSINRK